MVQSKRQSTHKQYDCYLQEWFSYCCEHGLSPHCCNVTKAIEFLEHLRLSRGLGYSAINTARSALSSILVPIDNISFGKHHLVRTYLRGVYNITPPVPRYHNTWDPALVLKLLQTWSPAKDLDLKTLTFKVVTLTLLVSGQRIQTLPFLSLDYMQKTDSCYTFRIYDHLKQSRPGYKNPVISLKAYPNDVSLCIFTFMLEYLSRTKNLRKDNYVFVCFKKPHGPASKDTITRWVKVVLEKAGIDTTIFAPHSIRSASSSAAERGGAPLQEILDTAGWSGDSVFGKFYNKPLVSSSSYDKAILQACTR